MAHGLKEDQQLVLKWHWRPSQPLSLNQHLPQNYYQDDQSFLAIQPPDTEWQTFRFSFPQLAKTTADLRFYRLVQIFNAPLQSVSSKDAGHSNFAYWQGEHQKFREGFRFAHFWFFHDEKDQDLVVLEFAYHGTLVLRSSLKSKEMLKQHFETIIWAAQQFGTNWPR